jgi:hypothetical protein
MLVFGLPKGTALVMPAETMPGMFRISSIRVRKNTAAFSLESYFGWGRRMRAVKR